MSGAGVEPLLRLRRHDRGQPAEVAGDEAHGVHRVAGGDGQRIGAEFDVALPGAVRRPGQDALAQQADMDGQHLADEAGLDLFLHVHQRRIDAGLQADRGDEPFALRQRRKFHRLGCRPSERPFAIDVLARLERRLGRRVVRRHAHDDRDRVDLRRGDHLAIVVERPAARRKPVAPPRRCRPWWCRPPSVPHPDWPAPPADGSAPTTCPARWRRSGRAESCPPSLPPDRSVLQRRAKRVEQMAGTVLARTCVVVAIEKRALLGNHQRGLPAGCLQLDGCQ